MAATIEAGVRRLPEHETDPLAVADLLEPDAPAGALAALHEPAVDDAPPQPDAPSDPVDPVVPMPDTSVPNSGDEGYDSTIIA